MACPRIAKLALLALLVACLPLTPAPVHAALLAPTELDQYMLELINRARANPAQEAASLGIDLNEGLPAGTISDAPKQPLAFNFNLNAAAAGHAQWLLDQDVFQHTGPGGNRPSDRARAAGYELNAPWGIGENLAWQGTSFTVPDPVITTTQLHGGLFVDEGIADRGHRTNLLTAGYREAGISVLTGQYQQYNAVMIANEFAYTAGDAFLTGVVYEDLVPDNFYTPAGEGYADVAIRAQNLATGDLYETTTFGTGGYSLQVPAGTYRVTFESNQLLPTIFREVQIGDENIKLDVLNSAALRPWSNPVNQFDADGNGLLEPRDVLVLIDNLNREGARSLSGVLAGESPITYIDVNRDELFSSVDILYVIDAINRQSLSGSSSMAGLLSFVETSGESAAVLVPEPAGLTLASLGLMGLLARARRRGRRVACRS